MNAYRPILAVSWRVGRRLFAAQLILKVCLGVVPAALALGTSRILDWASADSAPIRPLPASAGLIFLIGASAGAAIPGVQSYLQTRHGALVKQRASALVLDEICRRDGLVEYDRPRAHDRIRLAIDDTPIAVASLTPAIGSLLQGSVTLASLGVLLVRSDWLIAALAPLMLAPVLVAEYRSAADRSALQVESTHDRREFAHYADLLTDPRYAPELTVLRGRFALARRMIGLMRRVDDLELAVARREGIRSWVSAVLAALFAVGLLVRIGVLAQGGALQAGDVGILAAALLMTRSALQQLAIGGGLLHESRLRYEVFERMASQPQALVPGYAAISSTAPRFELHDVWFRYGADDADQSWILRGVSGSIPAGSSLALVGPNGSGKSTLLKLILRLYDPAKGSIQVNGVQLSELQLDSYWNGATVLFQEFVRYDLSIAENVIPLTERECSRVPMALTFAGLSDDVASLPYGSATQLSRQFGDGEGYELSGGQWQKLAAARLFARDASLVVLDEPCSALDAAAEQHFYRSTATRFSGATAIQVSHRLNSTVGADQIWFLSEGRIAERGTHDELMDLDGGYARLFSRQGAHVRVC